MLTTAQVDRFRTFDFTVLSGYLADRVDALRAEVDAAIRDAYAATYDERVIDGISGHYLPMAARLTPVSASLVCDDPRLIDAAEQLLGGPVIPECPEEVLYFAEAGWHTEPQYSRSGSRLRWLATQTRQRRRDLADQRQAAEAGMHGSPTLLINGVNPFAAPGQVASLSCRLYRDPAGHTEGVPPVDVLRRALRQASAGG